MWASNLIKTHSLTCFNFFSWISDPWWLKSLSVLGWHYQPANSITSSQSTMGWWLIGVPISFFKKNIAYTVGKIKISFNPILYFIFNGWVLINQKENLLWSDFWVSSIIVDMIFSKSTYRLSALHQNLVSHANLHAWSWYSLRHPCHGYDKNPISSNSLRFFQILLSSSLALTKKIEKFSCQWTLILILWLTTREGALRWRWT